MYAQRFTSDDNILYKPTQLTKELRFLSGIASDLLSFEFKAGMHYCCFFS